MPDLRLIKSEPIPQIAPMAALRLVSSEPIPGVQSQPMRVAQEPSYPQQFDPETGTFQPLPLGGIGAKMPNPVRGGVEAVKGIGRIVRAVPVALGGAPQTPEARAAASGEMFAGANRAVKGGMEAVSPVLAIPFAMSPFVTLAGVALYGAMEPKLKAAGKWAGLSDDQAELGANIASMLMLHGAFKGSQKVGESMRLAKSEFDARRVVQQAASEVLGVKPSATPAEIRTARITAAKELHPDINPNPAANAKLADVNAAADLLTMANGKRGKAGELLDKIADWWQGKAAVAPRAEPTITPAEQKMIGTGGGPAAGEVPRPQSAPVVTATPQPNPIPSEIRQPNAAPVTPAVPPSPVVPPSGAPIPVQAAPPLTQGPPSVAPLEPVAAPQGVAPTPTPQPSSGAPVAPQPSSVPAVEAVSPLPPSSELRVMKSEPIELGAGMASPAPASSVHPVKGPRPELTINIMRGAHDPVRVIFTDPLDKSVFQALSVKGDGSGVKNPDAMPWLLAQFPNLDRQAVIRAARAFQEDVKAQTKALPKQAESGVIGDLVARPTRTFRDYLNDAIAPRDVSSPASPVAPPEPPPVAATAPTVPAKEPWEIRKADLVPYVDTIPKPKSGQPADYGKWTEAEIDAATRKVRAGEMEPPDVPAHSVGSYGHDSSGELMQLREYTIDDPILKFNEGIPKNQTTQKYADWIAAGHEPPPMRGLETEKGTINVTDGHHRLAALKQAGRDKVQVWVSLTENVPIGKNDQGEAITSPRGVTHEQAVRNAIRAGKNVPAEVGADYSGVAKPDESPRSVSSATASSPYQQVDASAIKLDPSTYQFKESDTTGQTGRLKHVGEWDEMQGKASPVILHRRTNGDLFVADGHQRVNLAKRLLAEGKTVPELPALVLDEAQGWTAPDVRRAASLVNIRQDNASPIDIAKLLRDGPLTPEERVTIPRGNVQGERFAQAEELAKLGDSAFQAVVNGEVQPAQAQFVGRYVTDPAQQIAVLRELAKADLPNAYQAERFVKETIRDLAAVEKQPDMFGSPEGPVFESTAKEKAQILYAVQRQLASQKSTFGNALRNSTQLEAANNVLDAAANERMATEAGRFQTLLDAFADKEGYTQAALREAARKVHAGEIKPADAIAEVVSALQRDWKGEPAPPAVGQEVGDRAISHQNVGSANQPAAADAVGDEPLPPTRAELEAAGQSSMFGGGDDGQRFATRRIPPPPLFLDSAAQPALPGAESVREMDIPTPTFDVPFSLSSYANKAPTKRQVDAQQDRLFATRETARAQTNLGSQGRATGGQVGLVSAPGGASDVRGARLAPLAVTIAKGSPRLHIEAARAIAEAPHLFPEGTSVSANMQGVVFTSNLGRFVRGVIAKQASLPSVSPATVESLAAEASDAGVTTFSVDGVDVPLPTTPAEFGRLTPKQVNALRSQFEIGGYYNPATQTIVIGEDYALDPSAWSEEYWHHGVSLLSEAEKSAQGLSTVADEEAAHRAGQRVGSEVYERRGPPEKGEAGARYTTRAIGEKPGGLLPGFFSRVDQIAASLPAQAHPNKIASLMKSGAPAEELAFRGVPEFLKAAGDKPMSRAALLAHLAENPAPQIAIKSRSEHLPDLAFISAELSTLEPEMYRLKDEAGLTAHEGDYGPYGSQLNQANARLWAWAAAEGRADALPKVKALKLPTDVEDALLEYGRLAIRSRVLNEQMLEGKATGQTKFERYQVPGGENYRETLLTLPDQGEQGFQKLLAQRAEVDRAIQAHADTQPSPRFATHPPDLVEKYNAIQRQIDAMQTQQFKSNHWDEPNVIAHARSNERTLPTGEKGLFIEEVQSDWHQKGKTQGYKQAIPEAAKLSWQQFARNQGLSPEQATATFGDRSNPLFADYMQAYDAANDIALKNERTVPDAPFKENWPDLVLKQQLLEAAKRPDIEWIGFTSGKTQADRYNLSKYVERIYYDPQSQRLLAVGREGLGAQGNVIDRAVSPDELPDAIGKEAARKLLEQPLQAKRVLGNVSHVHVLDGTNLQVGGEGMAKFYDELLPKRLEKILKPFGGKVERGPVMASDYPPASTAGDLAAARARTRNGVEDEGQTTQAWYARLTPDIKAAILKNGLPLMDLVIGAVVLSKAEQARQDFYTRKAARGKQ